MITPEDLASLTVMELIEQAGGVEPVLQAMLDLLNQLSAK
jgi:hypothetical protein